MTTTEQTNNKPYSVTISKAVFEAYDTDGTVVFSTDLTEFIIDLLRIVYKDDVKQDFRDYYEELIVYFKEKHNCRFTATPVRQIIDAAFVAWEAFKKKSVEESKSAMPSR